MEISRRTILWSLPAAALASGQEGAALKRTMTLLSTSTPQRRNIVKILFYGQSITKQDWWMLVAGELRKRYPNADIHAVNRSIGGFAAPVLRRTLDSNVFPFYPDLIILHDYGSEEDYEWMIQEFKRRTTAEIALQTDHVAVGQKEEWHDKHSFEWMKDLSAKYGCEWMEIRQPWKDYLAKNAMKPQDLLTDGVHLNEAGNAFLASLVLQHFRETGPPAENPVRTVAVGEDVQWNDGRIELVFEGNRVEVITSRSAYQPYSRASFRIDGKKPSEFAETYAHTRISDTVGPDWPLAIRVTAEKRLVAEDWFVKVLENDERSEKFRFEVRGSVTGPDGAGVNTERFASKSGRVVIEPRDWWAAAAWKLSKKPMPAGYEAHWKAVALNADEWAQPRLDDLTREHVTVVASGLANTKHKLEIVADTAVMPKIGSIRIYRPTFK